MAAPKHASLEAALVAAQADMPAVEPNKQNPHFRSMFVSLDHLIAKTRPVLNKHGLSISQWPSVTEHGPVLRTVVAHESGGRLEADTPLLMQKQDMQQLGSAVTYARRYAWASACGISAEEDDDGESIAADEVARPQGASRGSAAAGSGRAGTGQAATPAPPAPDSVRDQLLAQLDTAADEWKVLKPEWDKGELTKWLGAKPRSEGELRAAIDTYRENIAVASSPFQVPKDPKAKAA